MVAGSLAALLFIHWLFVVVWVVGVGLLAVVARRFMAALSAQQSDNDELVGRIVNAYTDALAGRRTIRAAGTVEREVDRVTRPLPALAATSRNILRLMGRGAVVLQSADTGVLVATAIAGIWLLASGEATPGALLAAVRYAQMAYNSVAGVFDNGWFHIALLRSQASRVMELADAPAMKEGSCRAPADTLRRNIQLEDVWVHGEAHDILHGVSLEIPPGATIALVGESGVGKTTLATLLGRLHDPDRGTVRIDATPVQAWSSKALAERIAYAFESPALLGDTVRDAITLGYDADDAEVEAAARRVEADAFIRRLPKGYGTCLDETPMSGGERQRLGLARAALRDSPALVLDDALSSLDVATAGRVFAALGSLSQDRTAIIVAHRASTAATADLVAWLVDGRIERVATHADLWDDPAYRAAFVVTERDSAVDSAVVEDG
ncbi:MAG: ABC transporter ATP-binding protein [Gammaproteobacteria bacterium]|nr:ABC transporter ATP-binding protein [Gammaproteobacteria bacterium]